jgi:hypothetical protein
MYDLNYDGNSSDCVYNADETCLFYRMKPEYTLEKSGSKASGCKKSKERLTILFCSNADGTDKLLPLVFYINIKLIKHIQFLVYYLKVRF